MKFGERLTAFVARLTPTQKSAAGVLVLALAVGGTVGGLVAAAHDVASNDVPEGATAATHSPQPAGLEGRRLQRAGRQP